MSNKPLECPWCYKRCWNAGALKTHNKSEKKPKPKMAVELKHIVKAWSKRSRKFEAHQTKPETPDSHTKEITAASNAKQSSAKKAASGINGVARTAFGPTSKAIQTKSTEALILPFSKIIREGPTVYYCDHVTNVTYKIQCKYPGIKFERCFVEN